MAGEDADVFISYKAEDRGRLTPLVEALEDEGFSVWWDVHIGGGANWQEDIEDNLGAARCVIVAWSKRSVAHGGHFVRDEARRAQQRGAYLPIKLDAVDPPLGFGEVQAISLNGWRGDRADARFAALVDAVRERITGEHSARHSVHHAQSKISRRAAIGGGAVAAVAVAGIGAWELLKPSAAPASDSIAVLPFANLSGDPAQSYFSDGMADEIRSALTRLGGLTVIGSTSSEAVRNDDARTAARKLGVQNILTGNVRQSPSTIRITAELIDGHTGVDRWTQDYDRSPGDSIKIETDIAEKVASALKNALGIAARAAITLGGTADAVAQDLILQCRNLDRESRSDASLHRRLALAEAAIARDPNYAEAYAEKVASIVTMLSNLVLTPAEAADLIGQADTAGRKAVALAPRLGSAHLALADVAVSRLNFAAGLRETEKSLSLAPDDPEVLARASLYVALIRSAKEALPLAERGIVLDPLNGLLYFRKCQILIFLRRHAEAVEAGHKALALAPDFELAHTWIAFPLLYLGQTDSAKAEFEAGNDPFILERKALIAAQTGDRAQAERIVAQAKQQHGASATYLYSEIYAQLGDGDRAFAELDNLVRARDFGVAFLKVDPSFDPIRGDPRYTALLKRLDLA